MANYLEDTPAPSTPEGPIFMAVRRDAASGPSADGDVAHLSVDANGRLHVKTDAAAAAVLTDDTANPTTSGEAAFLYLWNGGTWDRQRGNTRQLVLGSSARTASLNSNVVTNYNWRGLHLGIDVTAITLTPSITVTIQGEDGGGQFYTILASAAITTVSFTVLRVYPGLVAAANLVANDVLPRAWRVSVTNGDADSITYGINAAMLL